MMDPAGTPATSEHLSRTRLLELKHRLSDLKLEALRRGYGLEPDVPSTGLDDLDAIVAEVTADVEQLRARQDGAGRSLRGGGCPASSRA